MQGIPVLHELVSVNPWSPSLYIAIRGCNGVSIDINGLTHFMNAYPYPTMHRIVHQIAPIMRSPISRQYPLMQSKKQPNTSLAIL